MSRRRLMIKMGLVFGVLLAGTLFFLVLAVDRASAPAAAVVTGTGSSTASDGGFPVAVFIVLLVAISAALTSAMQRRAGKAKRKHYDDDLEPNALADDDYIDLPESEEPADYFEGDVMDLDEKPKRSGDS
jgi:membrane protein implicated in regulation of membrane protease activity